MVTAGRQAGYLGVTYVTPSPCSQQGTVLAHVMGVQDVKLYQWGDKIQLPRPRRAPWKRG